MSSIIDFHAHVFPDKIAEKASGSIGTFYGMEANFGYEGSVSRLIEEGTKCGVTGFVIQSVATDPAQVVSINSFMGETVSKYKEVQAGFGTLHPDYEDIEGEIERMRALGLKGLKLHPDFQRFNIDDKRACMIYECIEGRMPLLVHMGDYRYDYSHPRRLASVLKMFPKLTVVGAHFAGWSVWDEAIAYLYDSPCYVDSCSTFAYLDDVSESRRLVNTWGAERILFGTDFPKVDYPREMEMFYAACADLNSEEMEKVLYKNALSVLKQGESACTNFLK